MIVSAWRGLSSFIRTQLGDVEDGLNGLNHIFGYPHISRMKDKINSFSTNNSKQIKTDPETMRKTNRTLAKD